MGLDTGGAATRSGAGGNRPQRGARERALLQDVASRDGRRVRAAAVAACHPEGQRWPVGRRQRPAAVLKEARKSGKDDGTVAGRGKTQVRRFSKKRTVSG